MALAELQRNCFGENRSHVAEAHGNLKEEQKTASFQHKNACKLHAIVLKPLDFPRENSMIFGMKINSFALAKTTCFSKTLKTQAQLSTRRVVYVSLWLGFCTVLAFFLELMINGSWFL